MSELSEFLVPSLGYVLGSGTLLLSNHLAVCFQWVSVQTGGWVRIVELWFCSVILLSEKFLPGVLTTGSSSLALPGPLQAKVYLGEGGG